MSLSINVAIIGGFLGADPELRYLPDGTPKATFSIATTKRWKDAGNVVNEKTTWHRVILFGASAEPAAKLLRKGSGVFFQGEMMNESYTDSKTGQTKYSHYVKASNWQLVDRDLSRRGNAEEGSSESRGAAPAAPAPSGNGGWTPPPTFHGDELPF